MGPFSQVAQISEVLVGIMPQGSWWGIRFLDDRYLQNWEWSPFLEVFRTEEGFNVRLSGSCHLEPGLTEWQKTELGFLGWTQADNLKCDCYLSPMLNSEIEASDMVTSALEALYFVYGISETCRIIGSNDAVNHHINEIPGIRFSRKSSAWFFTNQSKAKGDLR